MIEEDKNNLEHGIENFKLEKKQYWFELFSFFLKSAI